MGGYTNSKAMFELSQSMEWTRLEQTLKICHWAPLAIPIPDELVYKKVESEDKENHCCSLPEDHSSVKHYIVKNCEFL